MEIIALSIMILGLMIVFTMEARQKRRVFIDEREQKQ
jgi:hypothetical protein